MAYVTLNGNNLITGNNVFSGTTQFTGPSTVASLYAQNIEGVVYADQFPGATADVQIAAAIAGVTCCRWDRRLPWIWVNDSDPCWSGLGWFFQQVRHRAPEPYDQFSSHDQQLKPVCIPSVPRFRNCWRRRVHDDIQSGYAHVGFRCVPELRHRLGQRRRRICGF